MGIKLKNNYGVPIGDIEQNSHGTELGVRKCLLIP